MLDRFGSRLLLATCVAAFCCGVTATWAAASPAPSFTLTSTTFEDGGFVPLRMAYTKTPITRTVLARTSHRNCPGPIRVLA
jgi:hypothetical protein